METFFSGHFSPQIAKKRLSPPGRLLGISPTARAHENRYFGHKSGSEAQNPDFFGPSVAESPCATFRSPENLAETASTSPQTRFFWDFGRKRLSPQVTGHRPHCQRAQTGILDVNRAQRPKIRIFLAHRLRNHRAQLFGPLKICPKWPLRGPRSDFLAFLAVLGSPKKTQVPGPQKAQKRKKIEIPPK